MTREYCKPIRQRAAFQHRCLCWCAVSIAQQAQGIVEEAEARARRGGSRTLAEHALDLEARHAGETILEQSQDLDGSTIQTISLPEGSGTVRRLPRETR
ncbi:MULTISPECIES: hypothetical protein [Bradyrhizobium]|uniref:hypothetical protein n=1 Tax=Bradyrhizobium TaxID=374 RepID=UPI0010A960B1|nr:MULTISPECIES: hypothetical protein [Bradyrhizobium]